MKRENIIRIITWWLRQNIWRYLWIPVVISIAMSELVVCAMSLLLLGRIDNGYLLTGLVAAGLVSLIVCAILFYLADWLRGSEQRFRLLVENSPFCIHEIDLQGRLQSMNKAGLDMLGLDDEKKIRGIPYLNAVSEQDRERVKALLQDAINGTASHFEFDAAGDASQHFRSCFIPIKDASGKVAKLMGLTEDVTGRKHYETVLQQNAARIEMLMNAVAEGIYGVDMQGNCTFINSVGLHMLGYQKESELLGKHMHDLIHHTRPDGSFYPSADCRLYRCLLTHENIHVDDEVFWRKDGSSFPVDYWSHQTALNGEGGAVVTFIDITERKQAEAAQRASEERLRLTLEATSDGVWDHNFRSGVSYLSPRYYAMVGYRPEDITPDFEFFKRTVHPDDLPQVLEIMEAHMQGKTPLSEIEYRLIMPSGERKWILGRGRVAERDTTGAPLRMLGTITDITERKAAENMLRFHSNILSNLAEGIYLVRASDGVIVFANPQLERMFGYEPNELLGKHVSIVNAPDENSPEEMAAAIMNELARIGAWSGDVHNLRKDGTTFWCHASVSAFNHPQFGEIWISVHEDITERKNTENKLRESRQLLEGIVEHIPAMIFVKHASELHFELFNRAGEKLLGYSRNDLLGKGNYDFWPKEQGDWFTAADRKVLASKEVTEIPEEPIQTASGETRYLHTWKVALRDEDGKPTHLLGISVDITERKEAETELRIAATAFETEEGMIVADTHSVILRVNRAFTRITGYTAEEAVGQTPSLLKSGRQDADFYAAMWESIKRAGAWQGEIWNRRKNGEIYPEYLTITAVKGSDGEVTHYVATLHDISARKLAEAQIHEMAFHDSLTRLPNRRLLNDRLEQTMAASKRSGLYGALMFLDMDNFKPLNDAYGHKVGDALLVEVAQRISSCVRETDTVARFGGDEFVVMLSELDTDKTESAAQAGIVAEKIRAALAQPYVLRLEQAGTPETTIEHRCTSSIGAVLFLNHEASAGDILKWADMAMYQAKEAGRNSIRFYE